MRNLITILLLFFVFCESNAQIDNDPGFGTLLTNGVQTKNFDCREFDRYSDWINQSGFSTLGHTCEWVYAEKCDVNPCDEPKPVTTLAYVIPPPCGHTAREIEARICRHCFVEQRRDHTWGREQVKKDESEYSKLINRSKQ